MRTNSSADSRECGSALQHAGGIEEFAPFDVLDERRDVDAYRASLHTGRVGAVQTASGFGHGLLGTEADIHFFRARGGAVHRIEFRHDDTRDGRAFFRLHGLPDFLPPRCITVGQLAERSRGIHLGSIGRTGFFSLAIRIFGRASGCLCKPLHLFRLFLFKSAHTLEHLVEIDLMTVEFGAVHTDKACLSAHGDAAGTTHARAVYHDGIQGHISRDTVFLSEQAAEFHHDRRADGETFVHLFTLDDAFYAFGHQSFAAITAVVGHDDDLVRTFAYFVFQDNQLFASSGQHGNHAVARCLQGFDDGKHGSYAYSSSCTYHRTEFFDMRGFAQRTDHVGDIVPLIQVAQTGGRKSHLLYYQCDSAFDRIGTGYGQRHTFPLFSNADNYEMTGLPGFGYQRGFDFKLEDLFGKAAFGYDSVHCSIRLDL